MAAKKTLSSSKVKTYNSSIDINSPKGRFIAFMLAFAAIGGGLLVYKSFAALPTWTFSVANKNIIASSKPDDQSCKATVATDTGSKNPLQVVNLACTTTSTGYAQASIPGFNIDSTNAGKPYRLCADVKGNGTAELMFVGGSLPTSQTVTQAVAPNPNTYTKICTPVIWVNQTEIVQGSVKTSTKSTFMNVSSFTLEQMPLDFASTASTASTAQPAPAK